MGKDLLKSQFWTLVSAGVVGGLGFFALSRIGLSAGWALALYLLLGGALGAACYGLLRLILVRGLVRAFDQSDQEVHFLGDGPIARIAHNHNRLLGALQGLQQQISTTTTRLTADMDSVSSAAGRTLEGMRSQAEQVDLAATAVNEMSATVHEVARSAASAADAAQQADEHSQRGKAVVEQSRHQVNELAGAVALAAEVIERLQSESDAIGSILDVIRGIADQTNLLALNAAIEAARAGEQGRGFAVVADEVRNLAQGTQDSIQEIHGMIERLQSGASEAAAAMQQGQAQAEQSVTQSREAGEALESITRAVDTITEMNTQIASAAEEQSSVAEEINQNIARIVEEVHNTETVARETSDASVHVTELVGQLEALIRETRQGAGSAALDLSAAKSAHLAWRTKLRAFLDGRASLTLEQATSHTHCAFGQWYYGEGKAQFGHIPAMARIKEPHAELHRLIKDIIEAKQARRMSEAEELYKMVRPLSEQIVALIEEIEQAA